MSTVAVDGGSRNLWTAAADKLGRPAVASSRWMAEVRMREAKAARKAFTEAMSQYGRIFEEYPMRINMVIKLSADRDIRSVAVRILTLTGLRKH